VLRAFLSSEKVARERSLSNLTLWVDRCCSPQADKEVKAMCVSLLEGFVKHSNGMLVLWSWHYFSRLWCIYEWVCSLRNHSPEKILIGCDAFLKENPTDTLPLYLDTIERLSGHFARCTIESDRVCLEQKD